MIGVSHKTHKLVREKIIIMIGVLLEEKKSNEKAAKRHLIFMVYMTLTSFVVR